MTDSLACLLLGVGNPKWSNSGSRGRGKAAWEAWLHLSSMPHPSTIRACSGSEKGVFQCCHRPLFYLSFMLLHMENQNQSRKRSYSGRPGAMSAYLKSSALHGEDRSPFPRHLIAIIRDKRGRKQTDKITIRQSIRAHEAAETRCKLSGRCHALKLAERFFPALLGAFIAPLKQGFPNVFDWSLPWPTGSLAVIALLGLQSKALYWVVSFWARVAQEGEGARSQQLCWIHPRPFPRLCISNSDHGRALKLAPAKPEPLLKYSPCPRWAAVAS